MNKELLDKLKFQAAAQVSPLLEGSEWQRVFTEKFAELIVKECIGCCEQVISDPVPNDVDTWLNGGEQCIQEIKEHFGLGMSVEDKKQLIKDLLGVGNDTKS